MELNDVALLLVLGMLVWNAIGVFLAAWRQHGDENFLISLIMWSSFPVWFWAVPLSRFARQIVVGFWHGMEYIPDKRKPNDTHTHRTNQTRDRSRHV